MKDIIISEQQEAVRDWVVSGDGSLNLIARAGCGKTFTLINVAIKTIIDHDLGTVAIMAFNKSAADDFKERLQGDQCQRGIVSAGTVHSFGNAAVAQWAGKRVFLNKHKTLKICDQMAEEARDVLGHPQDHKCVYDSEKFVIRNLVSIAKQSGIGHSIDIDDRDAWNYLVDRHSINGVRDFGMAAVVQAAMIVLKKSNDMVNSVIDYDDMINAPLVHDMQMKQYDWVLIDEAQDTNNSRQALALKMLKPGGRLIAVGDDRQAIYGFTGADSNAMVNIANAMGSSTLGLTVTYRCPKNVVAEANTIVPDLVAHESAPDGEVRKVAAVDDEGVQWFINENVKDGDVVLCRKTAPLIKLAYAMLAKGKHCQIEGRDIASGLLNIIFKWKGISTIPELMEKAAERREVEVAKWAEKQNNRMIELEHDKYQCLKAIAEGMMASGGSLQDMTKWIKDMFSDESKKGIALSTIHKAKGREWDKVYLLGRDEHMPSTWAKKPWEMEQESNLEYVAITRAKNTLVFVD